MKMKTNKFLGSLLAVFVGIVLFVPGHALAAAFGVSPPWIENENIKPGTNFVYVINLSANELSDDMKVVAEFSGDPEIAQWLMIANKDSLTMAKGQSVTPMSVNVNVPADAKVGEYKGNLKLSLASEKAGTDNIAILLGGNIAITLGVVDKDVTDYWVQSISADPIAEGQAIDLKLSVKNLGNTDLKNLLTKVAVIDPKTGETVTEGSAENLTVPVYPQTMGETGLSIPAPDLKTGNYSLDVEAFKDGKSAYKNRLFFAVTAPGANNVLRTAVEVPKEGWVKSAASEDGRHGPNVDLKTSVTVRAPYTNKLIMVVIGILLILTGIVGKIYVDIKKKHR